MIDEKSMWRFAGVAPMAGPAEARHTHLQRNRAASPGQRIKWKRIDGRMHSMMFHDVPCISCISCMLHFKLPRCPRLPRSSKIFQGVSFLSARPDFGSVPMLRIADPPANWPKLSPRLAGVLPPLAGLVLEQAL